MGFYTTQKTKETMSSGVEESLAALQLDGVVTDSNYIEYIAFPVKLSVGKAALDLKDESVIVSVYLPNATLLNVYNGSASTDNATQDDLITTLGLGDDEAKFAICNDDGDSVLESTEKAFLMIRLGAEHRIADYEKVKIEVKASKGAALTVVRTAPGGMPASSFVDLG